MMATATRWEPLKSGSVQEHNNGKVTVMDGGASIQVHSLSGYAHAWLPEKYRLCHAVEVEASEPIPVEAIKWLMYFANEWQIVVDPAYDVVGPYADDVTTWLDKLKEGGDGNGE